MASGSQNMTTYNARTVTGSNSAASPAGALLLSGANRADDVTGDTWIFLDSLGGTSAPYGIKHDQANNKIQIIGAGTNSVWTRMNTGDTYILGKVGIGYDPETSENSYKLYVNGTSLFNGALDLKSDLNLYTSSADSPDIVWWYADKEQEQARIWMGSGGTSIFAPSYRCYKSDGTSLYSGNLVIGDGTGVTNAASFRSKLSTWALISDSYNTFMPPDGTTNGWYKFGTADGYGILPALSGGAENGHSYIGTSSWYWKYLYVDRAYTGKITIQQPAAHRDNGIVGEYNYQKAGAIWSMGASYQIKADGSGLGSLYGAAYGYGGQAYLGSNTYAGGHQFLWCENGTVKVALGQNIWTAGKVTATGGYADRTNGTATYLNYGASGLAASAISYLACWNGYELRAISKAEVRNAVVSAGMYWANVAVSSSSSTTTTPSFGACYSTDLRGAHVRLVSDWVGFYSAANAGGSRYGYIECNASRMYFRKENGVSTYHFDMNGGYLLTSRCYNAVWNDYAECRAVATEEPGRCVMESPSGEMQMTTKRLEPGCKIISDTYGTCIGATDTIKTPIAVSGRVLVYPYQDRNNYPLGAAVCSAPNGTVDLMTRDEIMMYPERIVGTVSEIPTYDIWHCGSKDLPEEVKVNGRIWIYVR